MRSLLNDPLIRDLPRKAFCPLGNLYINIGGLNLETPDRVNTAVEFLRGLNLNKILDDVTNSPFRTAAPTAKPVDLNTSTSDNVLKEIDPTPHSLPPPLTVKMNKLFVAEKYSFDFPGQPADFSKAETVWADVVDPTSRLERFRIALRHLWYNAGFLEGMVPSKLYKSQRIVALRSRLARPGPEYWEFERAQESLRAIDAKYKDFKWTEEFQLERLCLMRYDSTPQRVLDPLLRRRHDIMSVPLPGAKEDMPKVDEIRHSATFADLAT